MSESIAAPPRVRTVVHWLAGILVALLALGGISTPAFAAGGKVTVFPVESSTSQGGTPVLSEGAMYSFQIGYGSMDDGAVVAITVPEGITIPDAALTVPAGNTAVQSLAMNDQGQLVVTFMDPFPSDVNQGVLDLQFVVDVVESSEVRDLVWDVDGERTSQTVIVTDAGDSPVPTSTSSRKTTSRASLPHTVVDGEVVLDPSILDIEIPYTVTVGSKDARDVTLTDTLGTGLAYVPGSLSGTKVVRDANDLNPVSSTLTGLPDISGSSFDHDFTAEANSVYTFTYKAKIADAAALADLRDRLQAAYDGVDPLNGGGYSVSLGNTVDVNGQVRNASTSISGSVQGQVRPGTAAAFSKTVDPASVTLPEGLAAGATLDEGIPVTYTLGADLTAFADFADGPFALDRNVVIRDTLSAQISWNVDDEDFLVLVDASGAEVVLSPAPGLSGNAETEIAADEFVNTYVVSGRTIYINVGKDVTQRYTLTAKATIDSLPTSSSSQNQYETRYRADNTAYFVYDEGRYESKGASTTLIVPKDTSAGVDDPSKFAKTTSGRPITVTSGTSATIPYTFTIGQGIGDAASSRIIDDIDHSVFDVTEETLPQIKASISGTYDWNYPLDGDTFDVSIDEDGALVIAPNDAFPKQASWGASAPAPFTGTWTITVGLPTHVIQGKQTLEIENSARYEGADQEIVFTASASATATSYGNEMEVRKRVYDAANDAFTGNLRVATDAEGALVDDEFVYRVELMPHGTFTNMVEDVVDVLPEGVEFLGFVAAGDVSTGTTTGGSTYAIPGSNVVASYDAEANSVTLERGRLVSGQTLAMYFAVRIVDHEANVGITNVIGSAGATITPTNDYPLSLLKRDSTDAAKLITDSAARFSVLAADEQTVVLSDLRVVDGKIVTVEGATPVVAEPGTYWLREDVAPVGYERATSLSRILVEDSGASADVVLYNTPGETVEPEKTYAIGDVVWIDADKDGAQDDAEQVLPGVTVELLKDGEVIQATTTDANGRYLFDALPAGEYQVRFTLTAEQSAIYAFTTADAGDDDAVDSDADAQTGLTQTIVLGPDNQHLTHEYGWADVTATEGIDPTWDAGVIVRETGTEEPGTDPDTEEPGAGDADGGDQDVDSSHPGTPGVNELATTGATAPLGMIGIALVMLVAGAGVFFMRRRARG
ncbi:SdrD B-like domain-containing protein [Microbacterium sp. NPDC055903]